mgnify:CR=1 FL=1
MMQPKNTVAVLGDVHDGAQVCRIAEGETEYIWKPRNSDTELAFAAFLQSLGEAGFPYLPGQVRLVKQGDGWHTELPVAHSSTDADGIRRYYRRAGALVFLCYLFGATDLHAENLIADGEYPVLVDLETLLGAPAARTVDPEERSLLGSVLHSHLLPVFQTGEAAVQDVSGLSGVTAQGANLPLLNGVPQKITHYCSELAEGFAAAYRFALTHTELFDGLLGLFDRCRFRQLLRPTATYAAFLSVLAVAKPLQREPLAQTLVIRAYARDVDPQRAQIAAEAIRAEREALLHGEIPLFYTYGNETGLRSGGKSVLDGFLLCSPVDCARRRLHRLGEADLCKQQTLLELSYHALAPLPPHSPAKSGDPLAAIAAELEHCAVPGLPNGYFRLTHDTNGRAFFESVGFGLYDGLTGIACCYAAFYAKSGQAQWLERLDRLLAPFAQAVLDRPFSAPLSDSVCALSNGLGGMISALLHIAQLTGRDEWRTAAEGLAQKLDPARTGALSADLLNGGAGLALCLPRLSGQTALPLAQALAPTLEAAEPTLTGTAHGAAGLALTLGALQTVLGDGRYDGKILSLLQWENQYYCEEQRNWRDLRKPEKPAFMRGWCSGAPGIGMARSRLLSYSRDSRIRAVCETDIARVKDFLSLANDDARATLCCGLAASVMAGSCLGAVNDAQYAALCAVTSTAAPELLHPLQTGDDNVSLMQGLSGVGYALALCGNPLSGGMLL